LAPARHGPASGKGLQRARIPGPSAFGTIALLGLAVLAGRIASRYLSLAAEVWAFLLVGLDVEAAWLINLNLSTAWSIPVRDSKIAVTRVKQDLLARLRSFGLADIGEEWLFSTLLTAVEA
jgi:hypothetical protein